VARPEAEDATTCLEASAVEDAYRVAARRAPRLRGLSSQVFAARLSAFLARRGFDWETVTAVVHRLASEDLSKS
jgi:SOS response regulatory protein OraA/RecX